MTTNEENTNKPDPALSDLLPEQQAIALSLLDLLVEGVLVQDQTGKIIIYNSTAQSLLGLTREELAEGFSVRSDWKALADDGSAFLREEFPPEQVRKTGKPIKNFVLGLQYRETEITWININSYPVNDPSTGKICLVASSLSNITSIRRSMRESRISEKKLRSVLDSANNGIFLLNRNYDITLMNDYGKKMLNLVSENFHAETDSRINLIDKLPEHRKDYVKMILESVLKGKRVEYEVVYTKNDGSDIWIYTSYTPVKGVDGAIDAICLVANNITALRKKESALLKSEQRWKFALDGAGDGVWEYNFETKETYYSPLYKSMLGFSNEEFKNDVFEWRTRVHPDDEEMINDIDRQYNENELQNHSVEYRIMNKDGNYVWVLDRGMVLERNAEGKPLRIIGTHKNVTERKLAEETLIQSQQRFVSFMSNTPTMTWIVDEEGIFRYLNEPYMQAFRLSPSDIGRSLYDIFPKNIADNFVKNNWAVWNAGTAIEMIEEGVGPDGEQQFYQSFKFPLNSENGVRMLGGVSLDITKKLIIEKQLVAEEEIKKREIIQAIISAQEDERKELAYELHDNVNQILTSCKLMLEVASEKPELSAEFVSRSLIYLNEAIVEIRKISHNLTPGTLRDISLEAAIGEVIQAINTSGKMHIAYQDNSNTTVEVSAEIQLTALRICQEQLNNILKHSGATEASVNLVIFDDLLSMTVTDNGKGFNPSATKKGLGLNNIYNRVQFYHGVVALDSSPGNGCSLHIEIPLAAST